MLQVFRGFHIYIELLFGIIPVIFRIGETLFRWNLMPGGHGKKREGKVLVEIKVKMADQDTMATGSQPGHPN
jgi:hypothetical protein